MTTATAALPYGVVEGAKAIYGVSDEEAKAAADFVAPWSKDSQKIYKKDPETGELSYVDFSRLFTIHQSNAFFVTRLKSNTNYRRLYSAKVDKTKGVLCDQTIKLKNHYAKNNYPARLRRIKYFDKESNVLFDFVTNNFELEAIEIAQLYKHRWQIELFFKWIKQHLKIKSFWGYTENAVRIQIYTAIITYLTVAIMKETLKIKHTNYEILQILSITLLNKTQLNQLFQPIYQQNFKELNSNQLSMSELY
jgi:hypothetical protein